jgi:hypothetical protein
MTKLEQLLELVRQLPEGLRSDWRGTNHFELTQPNPDEGPYWWLDFREIEVDELRDRGDTLGERVGLVMDIAEAAKAAEEELGNVVLIKRRLREKHISVDEAIATLGEREP